MTRDANTVIESLGVHLPARAVSTAQILEECVRPLRLPLEWITGITSRRMAGDTEFAIDLARQAVSRCLANSRHGPDDIDLLICTNIARCDAPDQVWSFEPSTSIRLREHFGFNRALVFDITNACAGMFTGVYLVDALIKSGCIQRGMVVSGEYITPLTETAQKEIDGETDPRLACLTLGDSGAAVILEAAANDGVGFQALDLYTLGRYSACCKAGPTDQAHGGVTMITDMKQLAEVCARHGRLHAEHVGWEMGLRAEDVDWIIPHQTSRVTLDGLDLGNWHEGWERMSRKVINNLAERGNTASTTHFVALADHIANNRIQSDERLVFSVNASGVTIGTAVYRLDDLPDRLRDAASRGRTAPPGVATTRSQTFIANAHSPTVCIESVATVRPGDLPSPDTTSLLTLAAENCLQGSRYQREDIDVLIHTGVYRSGFIMEPAIATIAAGELRMNHDISSFEGGKTLAFDLFNGATGFLNACQVATELIHVGRARRVMVCASEIETNASSPAHRQYGLNDGASAVILHRSEGDSGFGTCVTRYFTDHLDACTSYGSTRYGPPIRMVYEKDPDLEDLFLQCILRTLPDLLQAAGVDLSRFRWILPPQISPTFIIALGNAIGVSSERLVDATRQGGDWFTSSVPIAFESIDRTQCAASGDLGLVIAVGSGIQVGCAIYHF